MDGLRVLDTEDGIVVADRRSKEEKMTKNFRMGSPQRKTLADISNVQRPTKPTNQDAKPQRTILLAKDYVDKLHKENMNMMKLLQERNKVIESHGIELQKLGINLLKLQQQNLQLAQANSQLLAELNSGKDRLRALQHELGCKNGLLEARKLVAKTKNMTCVSSENQVVSKLYILICKSLCITVILCRLVLFFKYSKVETEKIDKANEANGEDKKPYNTNRRWQSKNPSLGSSTDTSVQAKEKVDNKRPCLRRQSARFKSEEAEPSEESICLRRKSARLKSEEAEPSDERLCLRRQSASFKCEEPEPTEDRHSLGRQSAKSTKDLFEIDDAKFPVYPLHDELAHETGPTSSDLSVSKKQKEGNSALKVEALESRRRSSGRPSRLAAEKVQSYKEIPINVKMRRVS